MKNLKTPNLSLPHLPSIYSALVPHCLILAKQAKGHSKKLSSSLVIQPKTSNKTIPWVFEEATAPRCQTQKTGGKKQNLKKKKTRPPNNLKENHPKKKKKLKENQQDRKPGQRPRSVLLGDGGPQPVAALGQGFKRTGRGMNASVEARAAEICRKWRLSTYQEVLFNGVFLAKEVLYVA